MASSELLFLLTALWQMPLEPSSPGGSGTALLAAAILAWFFWLGAALGSYLNVLVYRLPLGLATVAPDSRCPKCQTPIRWYDNIPIFSWLMLGGKCRACRQPISPRYLLVEAVTGSLFALLCGVEVLTGGANLPLHMTPHLAGRSPIEHLLNGQLVGIYAYHAMLLWFVVGIALFAIDGHRVPRSFAVSAFVLLLVPPLIWPHLQPVPFWLPFAQPGAYYRIANVTSGVAAGAAGGILLALAAAHRGQNATRATMTVLGALLGGALGWHAALLWFVVTSGAWLLHLLACAATRRKGSQSVVLIAAASVVALLMGWSGFYEWFPHRIPGPLNCWLPFFRFSPSPLAGILIDV